MRTADAIIADVRRSLVALRKEAEKASRDAAFYAQQVSEMEADLESGNWNWNALARHGFITYEEAAEMKARGITGNRRRRSSRR